MIDGKRTNHVTPTTTKFIYEFVLVGGCFKKKEKVQVPCASDVSILGARRCTPRGKPCCGTKEMCTVNTFGHHQKRRRLKKRRGQSATGLNCAPHGSWSGYPTAGYPTAASPSHWMKLLLEDATRPKNIVVVKTSTIPGAGQGLFAAVNLKPRDIVTWVSGEWKMLRDISQDSFKYVLCRYF